MVIVVGGGISGLATGYALQERFKQAGHKMAITLIEGDRALGGTIKTEHRDGYLCESGPTGFLDNKPETLEICDRLNISGALLRSRDEARKRFIYASGRLFALPESPLGFLRFPLLSVGGRIRVLREPWTQDSSNGDESIAAFARRHVGKEAAAKLIDPMVTGIFAGNADTLSVKSCFPVMIDLEREGDGSLFKAMIRRMRQRRKQRVSGSKERKGSTEMGGGVLTSFEGGMAAIIESFAKAFEGEIVTGRKVAAIQGAKGSDRRHTVIIDGDKREEMNAESVIIAVPALSAAAILQDLDPALGTLLREIPYAPVAVVNLGYAVGDVPHPLDGFGYLIPSFEGRPILGTMWTSSIYEGQAPAGRVSLRTMVGGARRPELAGLDDRALISLVRGELKTILGIDADPEFVRLYRYERAIPQYTIGHEKRLEAIDAALTRHKGIFLTGNAYRGVGVNDCIHNANVTADLAFEYLSTVEGAAAS